MERHTVSRLHSSGKHYPRSALRNETDGDKFMPVCKRYYGKTTDSGTGGNSVATVSLAHTMMASYNE